jgi:hypothetical protein
LCIAFFSTCNFRGQAVYTPEQIVETLAVPITYSLINEIQDAFHCPPVLSSFAVFDLQYVPDSLQELHDYGKVYKDLIIQDNFEYVFFFQA